MKNFKYFLAIILVSCFIISCNDDGGDSNLGLDQGATIKVSKNENLDSFIDIYAVTAGEEVKIGFTIDNHFGEFASIDVILFYISGNTVNRVLYEANINSLPKSYELNQDDIIKAFSNLNSTADFKVGDQFVATADITLKNGTVIKLYNDDFTRNFGTDLTNVNTYQLNQTFTVACASNLDGTYEFTSTNFYVGSLADPGPFTGTVKLETISSGTYKISDGTFGFFEYMYEDPPAVGVTLVDVCNAIKFGGADNYGETYTMSNLVVNGSELTFDWVNTYGEGARTTLKRTDGSSWPELILE